MKTIKTAAICAVALSILLTAAIFYSFSSDPDTATVSKNLPNKEMFSFVKSMEGTIPDGQAQQVNDDLRVDVALRQMFDYYLTATGEKSLPEIRKEIEKELEKTLSPRAASQAKQVLARYIAYKQELAEIEKKPGLAGNALSAIKLRLASMQELRVRFFSAKENLAMFGFDDAYDTDAVARFEISEDRSLNQVQKEKKLLALDAAMPAALREEKEAPYKVIRLEENVTKMRAQGASDDDIYRMRAASTTPEAAARLADLDREEIEWKNRIATYRQEKSRLLASLKGNSEQEQLAAIQLIRDQGFNSSEQKRLGAYE
jgi:lipase chaperone LimK